MQWANQWLGLRFLFFFQFVTVFVLGMRLVVFCFMYCSTLCLSGIAATSQTLQIVHFGLCCVIVCGLFSSVAYLFVGHSCLRLRPRPEPGTVPMALPKRHARGQAFKRSLAEKGKKGDGKSKDGKH